MSTNQDSQALEQELESIERQIFELKQQRAALRRSVQGERVEDYELRGHDGEPVKLSALFGDKNDLLVIHNMGTGCPYCTLWADGFNGVWQYLDDRAAAVLVSADPIDTQKKFKAERGWTFPMYSGEGSGFIRAMGFEGEPHPDYGKFRPGASAFRRLDDGTIIRTAKTWFGPGDDFCSVWHLFDLFEGGPGDWEPRYNLKQA
jgi:predicted dithiol-disulfide oxidoreductase (DUF899 family)